MARGPIKGVTLGWMSGCVMGRVETESRRGPITDRVLEAVRPRVRGPVGPPMAPRACTGSCPHCGQRYHAGEQAARGWREGCTRVGYTPCHATRTTSSYMPWVNLVLGLPPSDSVNQTHPTLPPFLKSQITSKQILIRPSKAKGRRRPCPDWSVRGRQTEYWPRLRLGQY